MLQQNKIVEMIGMNLDELINLHYDKLNENIELPQNLNASLRDYQVEGFEFLKTLAN